MSWNPTFHAALARTEGVAAARRLAHAVHMRRCRLTADAALIGALGRIRPVEIELELETCERLELPELVLRGRARTVELRVSTERSTAELGYKRDADGHLASSFEVAAGSDLRDCVELALNIGVLALDRQVALATYATVAEARSLPVYADAFPLLASEIVATWPAPYYELHVTVDARHAAELVAVAHADAKLTIPIALDDEEVFAALADHDALGSVQWDEPDDAIWMQYELPGGGRADDGRVYAIELALHATTCELAISPVIDHMGTDNAAAWLSERAGAPLRYRPRD